MPQSDKISPSLEDREAQLLEREAALEQEKAAFEKKKTFRDNLYARITVPVKTMDRVITVLTIALVIVLAVGIFSGH